MADDISFETPVPIVSGDGKRSGNTMRVDDFSPRHKTAAFFHVAFKIGAIVDYLLCSFLSSSFVIAFVSIILLLAADFWTVKNVTGRLMVGLRWWNEVDAEGNSLWRFESNKTQSPNKADSRVFWMALYAAPVVWLLFAIVSFLKLNFEWLFIVFVGIVLSGANIYGYLKCEKDARSQVEGFAKNYLFSRLTKSAGLGGMSSHVTSV